MRRSTIQLKEAMRHNKTRDMMRSILPSKGRNGARFKRRKASRASRRAVRMILADERLSLDNDDSDATCKMHQANVIRSRNIREMMRDRRDGDKVAHFVRWCEALCGNAGIPENDLATRRSFIAAKIGGIGDVIREHAVGHFVPLWSIGYISRYSRYGQNDGRSTVYILGRRYDTEEIRAALKNAFVLHHKELNAAIKNASPAYRNPKYMGRYWRACKDTDSCIEKKMQKTTTFYFFPILGPNTYMYRQVASSYRPSVGTYEPNTLKIITVEKEVSVHHYDVCENRAIIKSLADIDKAMEHTDVLDVMLSVLIQRGYIQSQ